MSRDRKLTYTSAALLVLALLGALFLPAGNAKAITALFLAFSAVAIWMLLKKRPVLSMRKNTVLLLMFATGAVCLVVYYLTGVHFGFYQSSTPLSWNSFFTTVLPIAVIIVTIEIIRYVLLAQNVRCVWVFTYVAGVLSEVLLYSTLNRIITFGRFMDIVGLYLFPAITANLLYNFLAKQYGFLPNVVYRLLLTLYIHVLPLYPQTPDAFLALAKLVIPLLVYIFIRELYARGKARKTPRTKATEWVITGITAIVMFSIVMIISGQLHYHMIVIATPSMTGELNKGDAIIYEKYEGEPVRKGEIVVFTKDGESLIVHRVVEAHQLDGEVHYITKGDANEDTDSGFITDENIRGVVRYKLPYVGYLSLWLRELFK